MVIERRDLLRCQAAGGVLVAVLVLGSTMAHADLTSEVAHGQQVADAVRSGDQQCADLSTDDFETVGEYAMNRFIGNPSAHEAMNARMAQMMGTEGETAMHVALGHRYTACPGGPAGSWAMPMGAMMNRYGQGPSSGSGPGMMDGTPYAPMMGGDGGLGWANHHDDDASAWVVAAAALGGALLGGLLILFAMRRRAGEAG